MALNPAPKLTHQGANRLITPPAVEPITLDFLKAQLNIRDTGFDAYLTALIPDARKLLEDYTGIAFITQTWRVTMDDWPVQDTDWWAGTRQIPRSELTSGSGLGTITIPRYPAQSITTLTTYNEADAPTAVDVAAYFILDTASYPGRLRLRTGAVWPLALRNTNAIEITYVAGFGDAADDVPSPCRRAISVLAGYLFNHRGDGCEPSHAIRASGALDLVSGYTNRRI